MIETTHGMVVAISDDDGVTLVGENHDSVSVSKDQLVAIAAAHAVLRPEPGLGQSIYRSVDAHLIAQQAKVTAAEARLSRLRAVDSEGPRFGECAVCHAPIEHYRPPGDAFWSHFDHPADEHDAEPLLDPRVIQMDLAVAELQADPDTTLDGALGAMVDVLVGAAR